MRTTEKELFDRLIEFGGEPSPRKTRNQHWKILMPWPMIESNRVYCKKGTDDSYLIEASGRAADYLETILGARDTQKRIGHTEYSIWYLK